MKFSIFLQEAGIRREDITLLLHKTTLEPLRSQMAWMAAHRADLFAAYQAVHSEGAAAAIRNRPLVASFAPVQTGRHLFLGMFRVAEVVSVPYAEIYADLRYAELERDFGATDVGPTANLAKAGNQLRFNLRTTDSLAAYDGRIELKTPAGRNYARRGDTTDPEVTALYPHPMNAPAMPDWRALVISPGRLRNLPADWALRLAEWRGVYLITDKSNGARYVGAAYGADNLLGRWRQHVAGDAGITRKLRERRPEDFLFSILELTAPTAQPDEVIALETTWKTRLHTREWGLNEN